MSDMYFEIEDIQATPEQIAAWQAAVADAAPSPKTSKESRLLFFWCPLPILAKIALNSGNAELAVLAQLHEAWFKSFQRNPVKLTSKSLGKYGISRFARFRALKTLEKSGLIQVECRHGKNPVVTLKWHPLKK